MQLVGVDGVAKWMGKGFNSLMIQGEAWQRTVEQEKSSKDISMVAYFYPQI